MSQQRLTTLENKLNNWLNATCATPHPCPLPVFQNLIAHYKRHLDSLPQAGINQQRLNEFETMLVTIKFSKALGSCQIVKSEAKAPKVLTTGALKRNPTTTTLDIWDLTDDPEADELDVLFEEIKEVYREQKKYDLDIFKAALSFYGLPQTWEHCYRLDKSVGKTVQSTPDRAAQDGVPLWVQVNKPREGIEPGKAKNSDIEIYQNLTLDFEYAQAPMKVHAIAVEFAHWLVEEDYAEEGIPVEDSGAGAHIVLPIVPIKTSDIEGGPELLNRAVAKLVKKEFTEKFNSIAERYGLKGKLELDCYDLRRILSAPGTWRPAKADQPEAHTSISSGYQRRWLAPYNSKLFPGRNESLQLSSLVKKYCSMVVEEDTKPKVVSLDTKRTEKNGQKDKQAQAYARTTLDRVVAELANTMNGGRNKATNWAAFRIAQLYAGGIPFDESDAKRQIVDAAMQTGLPRDEAVRAANSGWNGGLRKPETVELKEFQVG